MAKACVLPGVVLVVFALLLLSCAFLAAEPAGRQWDQGREAAMTMARARGRLARKVLREGMVQADGDGDIAGSKRKSPGGSDPQHH
ncbi:hypothetical protein CFC21_013752 [Triticum aestivum]|nr:hypothetical protein CFC21_013752 [Triticum aestivum]